MLTIRASSLPAFSQCARSIVQPDHPVDSPNEMASIGNAVHEGMAQFVAGEMQDSPAELAHRHGVDEGDINWLLSEGRKMFWEIERTESLLRLETCVEEQMVSETLGGTRLTGHADFIDFGNTQTTIIDWKTGPLESDYSEQMKGYALLATELAPHGKADDDVVVYTVFLRLGKAHRTRHTVSQLRRWGASVVERSRQADDLPYVPGDHCKYCRARNSCGARAEALAIAPVEFGVLPWVSEVESIEALLAKPSFRQSLADTYQKAGAVVKAAEQFKANMKALIEERGPLDLGSHTLSLREQERTEIDAEKAWETLVQWLGTSAASAVSVKKGELEKAIKAASEKGKGAANLRAVFAQLDTAGAITKKPYTTLTISAKTEALPQ